MSIVQKNISPGKHTIPYASSWALVTGASGGMGQALARHLARSNYNLLLAVRNIEKGEQLAYQLEKQNNIQARALYVDFADITTLNPFISAALDHPLSLIMHNAGVLTPPQAFTKQHIHTTLQINTLAPAIITNALAPAMPRGSSIIYTLSVLIRFSRISFPFYENARKNKFAVYADAKSAALQLMQRYARIYPHIRFAGGDPGVVDTNMLSQGKWFDPLADIIFRPFAQSTDEGIASMLHCLSDTVPTGSVVRKTSIETHKAYAYNENIASALASETEDRARRYSIKGF